MENLSKESKIKKLLTCDNDNAETCCEKSFIKEN